MSLLGGAWLLGGCRSVPEPICDEQAQPGDLVLNELVANNEGVWIDETGALEDLIEIVNTSDRELSLDSFVVSDGKSEQQLPDELLAPGERIVLFADDDLDQGSRHLGFKLSSGGEQVSVLSCGNVIDEVTMPELGENESYSRYPDAEGEWERCRYATPEQEQRKAM